MKITIKVVLRLEQAVIGFGIVIENYLWEVGADMSSLNRLYDCDKLGVYPTRPTFWQIRHAFVHAMESGPVGIRGNRIRKLGSSQVKILESDIKLLRSVDCRSR